MDKIENFVTIGQKEEWIVGHPLMTDYGYIKSIKVKDKNKLSNEIEFIKLQGWQVKNQILKYLSGNDNEEDIKAMFKSNSFIICVKNNVQQLRKVYKKVFDKFFVDGFDEENFYTMGQEEFDTLRELILDFNSIPYRRVNPNEDIDRFDRMKYIIAQRKGQVVDFDAMYSTLMTKEGGGHNPWDINEFTMRQFSHAFKRVEYVKGNEVTTLYKTVDTDNRVEVVAWFKSALEEENEERSYGSIDDLRKSNAFMINKK